MYWFLPLVSGRRRNTAFYVAECNCIGFESNVSPFNDIDLRGINGERINDHWQDSTLT